MKNKEKRKSASHPYLHNGMRWFVGCFFAVFIFCVLILATSPNTVFRRQYTSHDFVLYRTLFSGEWLLYYGVIAGASLIWALASYRIIRNLPWKLLVFVFVVCFSCSAYIAIPLSLSQPISDERYCYPPIGLQSEPNPVRINACAQLDECQIMASSSNGIRAEGRYYGFRDYRMTYFTTQDAGKTWSEFMYGFSPAPLTNLCAGIGSYSANFFWYQTHGLLALTHDGGRTWHFLNASIFNALVHQNSSDFDLNKVRFESEQTGFLEINPPASIDYLFTTTDGGYTWRLVAEK